MKPPRVIYCRFPRVRLHALITRLLLVICTAWAVLVLVACAWANGGTEPDYIEILGVSVAPFVIVLVLTRVARFVVRGL